MISLRANFGACSHFSCCWQFGVKGFAERAKTLMGEGWTKLWDGGVIGNKVVTEHFKTSQLGKSWAAVRALIPFFSSQPCLSNTIRYMDWIYVDFENTSSAWRMEYYDCKRSQRVIILVVEWVKHWLGPASIWLWSLYPVWPRVNLVGSFEAVEWGNKDWEWKIWRQIMRAALVRSQLEQARMSVIWQLVLVSFSHSSFHKME